MLRCIGGADWLICCICGVDLLICCVGVKLNI